MVPNPGARLDDAHVSGARAAADYSSRPPRGERVGIDFCTVFRDGRSHRCQRFLFSGVICSAQIA